MRIVVVGNFGVGYKGTMAARALPIASELARRGYEPTLLVPRERTRAMATSWTDTLRLISVGPLLDIPFFGHLLLGLRMARRAIQLRPEVLYAFKPIGYAGLTLAVFWLLRQFGGRAVVLALDADDWEGEGGWADREPHPWWWRRLMIWQEQWCLQHVDVITVASRELARRVPSDGRRLVYAPNAASPSSPGWTPGNGDAIRHALGLTDGPVVLAYTRFLEFAPRRLVDVFEAVKERVPSAQLLVVGTGLHGEEDDFARIVAERGLTTAVHQVGWVSAESLPSYFAAADVAVYPIDDTLLNRAKCPMKLVDLLLAGVPVVADAVGQATEYVEDGATGFLVSAGAVTEMAERTIALLRDARWREQIGRAARASLLEKRTWAQEATRIAEALTPAGRLPV